MYWQILTKPQNFYGISKIRKLETVKAVTVDNPSFKTKSEFRLNTNLETNMVIS